LLHRALAYADERRHEYATLEHLLLALTEDQDAIAVLHACGVDLGVLNYVDNELGNLVATHGDDAKPTAGLQRVLQRAAIHIQSSGREEVTGAKRPRSHVRRTRKPRCLLSTRTGHDPVRCGQLYYISHGIAKAPGRSETRRVHETGEDERVEKPQKRDRIEVTGFVSWVRTRETRGDPVTVAPTSIGPNGK
jgi:ATP-dependent Clp protease ATP-binding subunit ClpA